MRVLSLEATSRSGGIFDGILVSELQNPSIPGIQQEMQSNQQGLTLKCAFLSEHHIFVPSGELT